MEYKIILTEAQYKALCYVAYDPQDWIQNAIYERCRVAIDQIVSEEVERITSEGGTLSGTKEDIVIAAPILSCKERMDQQISSENSEQILES